MDAFALLAPTGSSDFGYISIGETATLWASDVALLISFIPVSMWIYRAHANLETADLPGLEYSPGWSVGWFFVPIAALWKPFSAMRELWNASHGAVGDYSDNAPALLWTWWLGWIFSNLGGVDAIDVTLDTIGSSCLIASAGALGMIVHAVTRQQESFGLGEIFA